MKLNTIWAICCLGLLYRGGPVEAGNKNLDLTMPEVEDKEPKMSPYNPWKVESLEEAVDLCCDTIIYFVTKCFERVGFTIIDTDPCGFQRLSFCSTVGSIKSTTDAQRVRSTIPTAPTSHDQGSYPQATTNILAVVDTSPGGNLEAAHPDIDDNNLNNNRSLFYFDKYDNTSTGVDLNPKAPARQPSVTPPPALHISGENVNNQTAQQVPPQQPAQRPPQRITRLPPLRTTTRRPILQRPQRPAQLRPIPQNPSVSRSSTQRPPLRPVVEEPSQSLDGPGSESSQGDSCIWAIVRCCNQDPRPTSIPRCFELLGCPGAYFGNPCESDIGMSVARAAKEVLSNGIDFT